MAKKRFRPPVKQKAPKGLKKTIEKLTEQQKDRDALRKELHGMAHKALKEEFGTFDETFKAMLLEHRVMKKIFMEKFGVTLEEWNKTYKEIKDKQKK